MCVCAVAVQHAHSVCMPCDLLVHNKVPLCNRSREAVPAAYSALDAGHQKHVCVCMCVKCVVLTSRKCLRRVSCMLWEQDGGGVGLTSVGLTSCCNACQAALVESLFVTRSTAALSLHSMVFLGVLQRVSSAQGRLLLLLSAPRQTCAMQWLFSLLSPLDISLMANARCSFL